ncbi:MAG TPA: hypothetical protein PK599_03885, partial [bacterium]|nr:hypothetical protein [bacterium]
VRPSDGRRLNALIRVPNKVDRFIRLPDVDGVTRFELLEALIGRGLGLESCREFLVKANSFAEATGEEKYIELTSKMLQAFDADFPELLGETGEGSLENRFAEES